MSVKFENNTIEVQSKMAEAAYRVLEEVSGEFESAVKRNTAVDSGQTKNSWRHRVTGSMMAGTFIAEVGSDYENAIREEFGTGEYAQNGDGRKGGWVYRDDWGCYWFTLGKPPKRPLFNTYTSKKNSIVKRIQSAIKGAMS